MKALPKPAGEWTVPPDLKPHEVMLLFHGRIYQVIYPDGSMEWLTKPIGWARVDKRDLPGGDGGLPLPLRKRA